MIDIIKDHFRTAICSAFAKERVALNEISQQYLIDMLSGFVSSNQMGPDPGLPTLTLLYRDALEATGAKRIIAFKRLGDMSLFLSGFFIDYVRHTMNGVGYYIDMGSAAYDSIARESSNPVFSELSKKFVPVVGVLNTASAGALTHEDLIDMYVRDTTSLFIRRKLASKGSVVINTLGIG